MATQVIQNNSSSSSDTIPLIDLSTCSLIEESKFPVYLVDSPVHSSKLAVKIFPANSEASNCFEREARISHLEHDNIIKIVETSPTGKKNSQNYILMEFAPYGDLYTVLQDGKLPQSEKMVRTIMKEILKGVEYLHDNSICHLDLKLENILVGKDGRFKIADFDCCFIKGTDNKVITRGTVNYRAPEIMSPEDECVEPELADVYSLGIMMFSLMTGMIPYTEEDDSPAMNQLL
jgi:serine/threonine protein kinase